MNEQKKIYEDCNICCEKLNKGHRKEVKCPYCDFICCLSCFKRYLLDSTDLDCMSCHKELSLNFIKETTPKNFHNGEYREKRAKDLLSKEKSLLPSTQPFVERLLEQKKNEEELKNLLLIQKQLQENLKNVKNRVSVLRDRIHEYVFCSDDMKDKEKNKFIMKCPTDECRGFLSEKWKCGTCNIDVCNKCREIKENEHNCDTDTLETVKLLEKDTKPCPNCAVPIHKLEGCDQMWCIECKTPFSWKTGRIVKGVIHNPHYYEWQRKMNNGVAPRVPGDNPCNDIDGLPSLPDITYSLHVSKQRFKYTHNAHRLARHIKHVVLPMYQTDDLTDNRDLRIKYLIKDINEDEWISLLKKRQKKIEKNKDIYQVLEMFVSTLEDIFMNFVINNKAIILELACGDLLRYTNNNLEKIAYKYNNSVPIIFDNWCINK